MSRTTRITIFLSCLAAAGCSSLDNASDTYKSFVIGNNGGGGTGGGTASGGAGAGGGMEAGPPGPSPWGCLDNPPMFTPAANPPAMIEYRVSVKDFQLAIPVPNLSVKVCIIGDADCTAPYPFPVTNPVPQDKRVISVMMPFGWQGFLRLNSAGAPPAGSDAGAVGYVQTDYYFGGPIVGSPSDPAMVHGEDILVPRLDELANFFGDVAAVPNPKAGILAVRTIDCNTSRAPGVLLNLITTQGVADPGFPFTLKGGVPFRSTPPTPTDYQGVAGFANIEPFEKFTVVSVQGRAPTGAIYPSDAATSSFRIRANQLTLGELRPDYSYGK